MTTNDFGGEKQLIELWGGPEDRIEETHEMNLDIRV